MWHKRALHFGYTGILDRYEKDPDFVRNMTEKGFTRYDVERFHEENLRQFGQGHHTHVSRAYRQEHYGRWKNKDEERRRREQGLPRKWEWTQKQWDEWTSSRAWEDYQWQEHHWR